jgi:hypothetical protein
LEIAFPKFVESEKGGGFDFLNVRVLNHADNVAKKI